jgi:hypothetical protein
MLTPVDWVHMLTGDARLRGIGVAGTKSKLLLFVSVQPSDLRMIALVLLAAGAGALPLKQEAVEPYPARSMMLGSLGHAPVIGVVVFTSATLPAAAAMAIVPVASGCGSALPLLAPAACWTR